MGYLRSLLDVFLRYKYLMMNLVKRDLSVRYRRSVLGVLWSFLNPLFMMFIMTAVFSYIFNQEIPYFPVYLLAGQLMFNFFNESTTLAMDSILGNAGLIKKIYIPKYIFPLEKVIFSFVNTLFSLLALLLVALVLGVPFTPWTLLFPVPLIILFVFNVGVGMILSCFVVYFRDIKHIYGIFTLALTYLTPLFYPESILPPGVLLVAKINPLYWFVKLFRQFVLYGQPPTLAMVAIPAFWAVVMIIIGPIVMKKTQDNFILHI